MAGGARRGEAVRTITATAIGNAVKMFRASPARRLLRSHGRRRERTPDELIPEAMERRV
jgi:hypothetical protein